MKKSIALTCIIALSFAGQNFAQCLFSDSTDLHTTVAAFSHDSMKGRLAFTDDAHKAAGMIADSFRQYGLSPMFDEGFLHAFASRGKTDYNVVSILPGKTKPTEFVFISAHYDHIGTVRNSRHLELGQTLNANWKDSVFNGANDNASGIAMLLALAKYYSCEASNGRTLCFIAFGGEELGLLGSTALATDVVTERIAAHINFDMVGRFPKGTRARTGISGDDNSDLRALLNKCLEEQDTLDKTWTFYRDPEPEAKLFERSDNFPFALAGVPAHTIIATKDSDRYYHSLADEAETLDYPGMVLLFRKLLVGFGRIVSGADTPRRIKQ